MLSVVITTKNEEENIGRCIKSTQPLADEVIVIDSGSEDRTVEIARNLGAKVFYNKWIDYPVQVQYGIERASMNYILVLDADEELSEELRCSIKKVIENRENECYQLNRRTYYLGRFLKHVWHPEWRTRLFKKGMARYEGQLHEEVVCMGKTGRLEGDLYHYSYKNLEDQLTRIIRYAKTSAQIMHENGRRFRLINLLVNPLWAFMKVFIKKGFLDGYRSFIIGVFEFIYTFLKYAFLLEINLKNGKKGIYGDKIITAKNNKDENCNS